jgi:hypothetical protein
MELDEVSFFKIELKDMQLTKLQMRDQLENEVRITGLRLLELKLIRCTATPDRRGYVLGPSTGDVDHQRESKSSPYLHWYHGLSTGKQIQDALKKCF